MNFNEDVKKIVQFIPKFEQLLSRLSKLEECTCEPQKPYDDSKLVAEIDKLKRVEPQKPYDDSLIKNGLDDLLKKMNKSMQSNDKFELKITRLFESFRDSESGQTARMIKSLETRVDELESNNGKR